MGECLPDRVRLSSPPHCSLIAIRPGAGGGKGSVRRPQGCLAVARKRCDERLDVQGVAAEAGCWNTKRRHAQRLLYQLRGDILLNRPRRPASGRTQARRRYPCRQAALSNTRGMRGGSRLLANRSRVSGQQIASSAQAHGQPAAAVMGCAELPTGSAGARKQSDRREKSSEYQPWSPAWRPTGPPPPRPSP